MEEGETREVGEEGSWDNPQGQMLPRGQRACHAEHRVESLPENQQKEEKDVSQDYLAKSSTEVNAVAWTHDLLKPIVGIRRNTELKSMIC